MWFQCVCPLMPSCNTYPLTWVSLTLGVGYLFTVAPAKHSRCSLPWTKGISSPPPFLTFLQRGMAPLGPPAPAQPLLLGRRLIFPAAAPGLGRGVAPPGPRPWPCSQGGSSRPFLRRHSLALSPAAPDLRRWVAPPGRRSLLPIR